MDATAPTESAFTSPSAFDGRDAPARDQRYDNQPPLEERILLEYAEDLDKLGITARIAELLESAARVPECTDDTIAGRIGDLVKIAAAVGKRVEEARETHNRPLLNAQRGLKSKADSVLAPLVTAMTAVRGKLNTYMQEKARAAEAERRAAEEAARRLREEQERITREVEEETGVPIESLVPVIEAPKVAAPVARGDLGARVGTRTVWHHKIENVRHVPDRFLKHPRVVEALGQVIGQAVRGGEHNIKGVRVWSTQEAAVR